MTWGKLFFLLWQADWSSTDIADAYAVDEELVRVLVASHWVEFLPEEEAA